MHTRTQEKGAVAPPETDPDLPMSVQEAPAEAWTGSGLLQGRGHCVGQCVHWAFRRRSPSSSPLFGLRPSNREGTQPRPSTENWIKDLLNMAPHIRTRPSFPLSQFLPSGSFHKPLILIHQRAGRTKPQSQKTNQSDHMDHSFV